MSNNEARVQAVHQVMNREPIPTGTPQRLEDMWATNVFNLSKMQASLPKAVFKSLKETITNGQKLDPSVADSVATADERLGHFQGGTLLRPRVLPDDKFHSGKTRRFYFRASGWQCYF